MKKTIVAAAIAAAVAAPAAFADVSISGQINVEFYKSDASVTNGTATAADDLAFDRNTDLVFKASEDLGNGMKAFATISLVDDAGSNSASSGNAGLSSSSTNIVGLSGDFGTVTFGKQEMWTESAVAAMANNDAADYLSNEVGTALGASAEATAIYTSPSFNGVTVVLGGRGTTGTDDFDTTEVGVQYAANGLTVRASNIDGGTTDTTVVAASYKMGDFTVGAVNQSTNESSVYDETWYGVSYAMGANTISISTTDSDAAANEDTVLSLKHALSKNTAVYLVHENDGTANADTTLVGMQVKF
jgi:predicted porin